MHARVVLCTLVSALALAACNEKKAPPDTPAPTSSDKVTAAPSAPPTASVVAAPSASAPAAEPQRGLHAPGNDAEVVKEIEKVTGSCKWGSTEFAGACKPMQDWIEWASFPGRQEMLPTLVEILADKSPAVRHVAAMGLAVSGTRPIKDAAIASALLDALEKERNPNNCGGIALQAAAIKLTDTKLDERALNVARTHPLSLCRVTLVGAFLRQNPEQYDFVIELAKADKDPKVRAEAVGAMRDGARKDAARQQNNCKTWRTFLDDAEPEVAARAAEMIGRVGGTDFDAPCVEEWDALLTHVESAATAGKVSSTKLPWGVCGLFEQKKLSAEQKTKAIAILQKLLDNNANTEPSRMSALTCLGRHDPDAKTIAQKFEQDPAPKVAKAAKLILDAKPN